MTAPADKREGRWFTALRGLRIEKHKAATKRWVKRRLAKARRHGASSKGE
jgi:hypothetical protein